MWDNVGIRITRTPGGTSYASATGTLVPLPGVGASIRAGGSTVTIGRGGLLVLLGVTVSLAALHVWTRGYQG